LDEKVIDTPLLVSLHMKKSFVLYLILFALSILLLLLSPFPQSLSSLSLALSRLISLSSSSHLLFLLLLLPIPPLLPPFSPFSSCFAPLQTFPTNINLLLSTLPSGRISLCWFFSYISFL
jgi:hypothetical protein